jgi:hypothetical protein
MAGPGVDLVQVVFDRSAMSASEDVAVITMHCRGVQAALPDSLFPLDDAGRDNFKTKLDTFFAYWASHSSPDYKITDYKFYALPDALGTPMGDPTKHYVVSIPGAAGPGPPPQVATSITFKTDKRKQWGRFYLPGISSSYYDSHGRMGASTCAALASQAHGLTSRSGNGGCLTVWSRTQWTHHDPQVIQVDDIPDVIRSRRFSAAITRATQPAG